MCEELYGFGLKDLSFLTCEDMSHEDYLWSQIELSANESKFELCDSLLTLWTNTCLAIDDDRSGQRSDGNQNETKVCDFLINCYKHNYGNENIWFVYQLITKYNFDYLVDNKGLEIELILRNNFDVNQKQINYLITASKLSPLEPMDEKMVIIIRNFISFKPKITKLLIDLFEDKNCFNYIFTQCLIQALKSDNKPLILDILGVYPDLEIDKNVKLLDQICDLFCSDRQNEFLLYKSILLRNSPKLIKTLSQIRQQKIANDLYDFERHCFDFKKCFLLAANHRKHFLDQLLSDERVGYDLPPKQSLYFLIHSLHNKCLRLDTFDQIIDKISKLVFDCDEIVAISKADPMIRSLVKRLRFIINFTKWCINRMDINCKTNAIQNRLSIFQTLFLCESPLKILLKHGFLCNKSEVNEGVIEEICGLLCDYNESELMIYRGFLAIRHTIIWMIMSESETFEEQIAFLLKKIYPIDFRVEILENIFSLLFLTQNELIDNETDEEDYTEDTVGELDQTITSQTNQNSNTFLRNTYFLCPNSLVPQLLSTLKDVIIDSQAALFAYHYKKSDGMSTIKLNSSIKDLSDCKSRLDRLLQYVSEGQWRYDVIEPAFNKNTLIHDKNKSKSNPSVDAIETDVEDILNEREYLREMSSSSSCCDNEKQSKDIFSSVISCMLASPQQLLRYSLIEGQTDRAKQVVKLFEHLLKNSEEVRELEIISKWKELSVKLKTMSLQQKSKNTSKMTEMSAIGLRSTQIQTIIDELMAELQVNDITKNSIMIDFALTTCPSIDISEIILDFILQNQSIGQTFPEKIKSLLIRIRLMITELSKEYDIKSITFDTILTQFVENDNIFNANVFLEQKRNEKQLIFAFEELHKHLTTLESRDELLEPTISSPTHDSKESKRTNVLFEKLLRLCPFGKNQYLKVLFYYVRKVTKTLNECRKRSHSMSLCYNEWSYFSILLQSPSAILCSMVLKDGISPKFVDDFAKEMKVDLMGTLCSVLCPKIPSHLQNNCVINEFILTESCHPALCELIEVHLRGDKQSAQEMDSLLIQNHFDIESDSLNDSYIDEKVRNIDLIHYFSNRSPILVELMKEIRLIKHDFNTNSDFKFTDNSPLLKWIEIIKSKFGCIAGTDTTGVVSLALCPRITTSNTIVMKTLENHAMKGNLIEIYDLFNYIEIINTSDSFVSINSSFNSLRNAVLSRLTLEQQDLKYCLQIIDDPNTKCKVVIDLIEISNEFDSSYSGIRALKSCLSSLTHEMQSQDMTQFKDKLIAKINEIEFYTKIGHLTGLHSWKDTKHNVNAIDILTIIKTKRKYSMAIDWFNINGWETETSDLQFELLVLAYCQQNHLSALTQLLLTSDVIEINSLSLIGKALNNVSNFDLRIFLIEFILNHFSNSNEMIEYYNNYILGIKLIKGLDPKVQSNFVNIITKPMLIIEQMLMNIEVEALEEAVKVLNFDCLVETYAQKAVEIPIYDIPSTGVSVISDATLISSTFLETKNSLKTFLMPECIPTKDQWIPDSNVTHCMLCKIEKFSMLNRRHHCRRCGRVVCGNCSQNSLLIREIKSNSLVRVCDECYVQTQRNNRRESISESSSLNRPTVWVLTCDDLQNDSLRMEFYYDSSPSVSLCLTLLRLHSDKNRCCKVIVDSICKPLLETVVSSQVDNGLVIGMIRSLLVSTRISMEEQNCDLIQQLNHLLERLDVIRMLINSFCNTKEIISYALSSNDNSILKLQERLIEMERFELARDLATKFGLDSKSLFKTEAFICLKHSKYSKARDLFRLAFDKNKTTEGNRNVENIINVLSKRKYWSDCSLREECLQIKGAKVKQFAKLFSDSNDLQTRNPKIFNEMMYYMEEYGTNEDIIKFYIKHSMSKRAINLLLSYSNSYSNNFFMKELFMTSIKMGLFSTFLRDLKSCDPGLTRCWKYLLAACKYLSSNHLFHVLHVLQVFMGDHLRAAITQINCFFLSPPASDYMELKAREVNLQTAKQHCRDFLSLSPNEYHSGCLIMEREDIMRQMRALNLQIDITNKFYEKRVKGFLPNGVIDDNNQYNSPPTLLDHNKARKTELTALVTISYGSQINEGFGVSQMIIKDHKLDSSQVYRLAGRALVQMTNTRVMDSVSQLLECIRASTVATVVDTSLCDDVIGACIRSCSDHSLIEPLIKQLSNDINKIDAYILTSSTIPSNLKFAYILATNLKRETDVLRILEASKRANNPQIAKICKMWLKKYGKQSSD